MNPYALLLGLAVHMYCLHPRRLDCGSISPLVLITTSPATLPHLRFENQDPGACSAQRTHNRPSLLRAVLLCAGTQSGNWRTMLVKRSTPI